MDSMMKLKEAHKQAMGVMGRYAEFGARDTEPDGVYQQALVDQLVRVANGDGKGPVVPRSARGWQLYTSMNGCGKAAKEIGQATTRVCRAMRAAIADGHWRDVCLWAQDVCWRCPVHWISD